MFGFGFLEFIQHLHGWLEMLQSEDPAGGQDATPFPSL
jgi:hypothetical protein